jgi:hypothetical protein
MYSSLMFSFLLGSIVTKLGLVQLHFGPKNSIYDSVFYAPQFLQTFFDYPDLNFLNSYKRGLTS